MRKARILLIGDTARAEFRGFFDRLAERALVFHALDRVAAEALVLADVFLPELIILLQAYPGEYPEEWVNRLRGVVPLAPVVAVLGSLCEGETRSGTPCPGVFRLYWYEWDSIGEPQFERWTQDELCLWNLPAASIDLDHRLFLGTYEKPPPVQGRGKAENSVGGVGICTRDWAMFDWLRDVCQQRGFRSTWIRWGSAVASCPELRPRNTLRAGSAKCSPPFSAIASLSAGVRLQGLIIDLMEDMALRTFFPDGVFDTWPRVPMLMLADFPREDEIARCRQIGVRVLSKPVYLPALHRWLDSLKNVLD